MSAPLAFPKPTTLKDPQYLDWIASQPCLLHPSVTADAHHTRHRSAGGSDYRTLPFCRKCHSDIHRMGKKTFQDKRSVDFQEEIIRHLETYVSAQLEK